MGPSTRRAVARVRASRRYDHDVCESLFKLQSLTDADIHSLLVFVLVIGTVVGYVLATMLAIATLYKVFQVAALTWDTDGDGVVEFSEVKQAFKVLLGFAILRVRDWWNERKGRPTRKDEENYKTMEWRAALYGILDTIKRINNIQYVLLMLLIFWPPKLISGLLNPCYECTDFHLTLVTQLGLILGLQNYTQPSMQDGLNHANATTPNAEAPSAASALLNSSNATAAIFVTNRSAGYNCSHPLQAVGKVSSIDWAASDDAVPTSLMGQKPPARFTLKGGWPRQICPTNDDADGLRYLYPECDELIGSCELAGGAATPINESDPAVIGPPGCQRFVPHPAKPYSIIDYYAPLATSNWSNTNLSSGGVSPWKELPLGRAAQDHTCVRSRPQQKILTTGGFRMSFTFAQSLFWPLVLLLAAKMMSYICLYMPWMKRTRKRNEKLQRTLAKRRAEVRRMTEGGQEFVVKRAAKAKGKEDVAQTALAELNMKNIEKNRDGTKEKKAEVGGKFLTKIKREETASNFKGSPAEGSGVGGSAVGALATIEGPAAPAPAPSMAIVSAGTSGDGEGFVQDLKKLSAAAEEADAAEEAKTKEGEEAGK